MNPVSRMILAAALLATWSCQDDRLAGTSTETENAVASRAFRIDSLLGAPPDSLRQPAVVVLRLDSASVEFDSTDEAARDLDVRTTDGLHLPFDVRFWDRRDRKGRLHVRLDSGEAKPGAALQVLWKLPLAHRADPVAVWNGVAEARALAANSALVDDFEGGNLMRSRLPIGSFWFLGGSYANSGLAAAGSGRTGTALRVTCNAGQCDTGRALLAATLLANRPHSLRSLDSLVLWSRGSGRAWITLEYLDSLQMRLVSQGKLDSLRPRRAWAPVDLQPEWTRVALPPSAFLPTDGWNGNVGWDGVRDSVNYFTVLLEGGSQIWLDDIRFHGINPDDLR